MSVMDVRHVSVLMLGAGMHMFVGMGTVSMLMCMELIMAVPMFMHNRHMDMKMGVLFICQ